MIKIKWFKMEGYFMKFLRMIVKLLIIVGALNWGLVGFFKYNLVADLFGGETAMMARVIFALVGLAGLFSLGCFCQKCCCSCGCSICGTKKGPGSQQPM
jgi:uncharacterized protein